MQATIQSVSKVGENLVSVQFQLTDGSIEELRFPIDTTKADIKNAIKAEVARLNTIEAKVADLANDLVGKTF